MLEFAVSCHFFNTQYACVSTSLKSRLISCKLVEDIPREPARMDIFPWIWRVHRKRSTSDIKVVVGVIVDGVWGKSLAINIEVCVNIMLVYNVIFFVNIYLIVCVVYWFLRETSGICPKYTEMHLYYYITTQFLTVDPFEAHVVETVAQLVVKCQQDLLVNSFDSMKCANNIQIINVHPKMFHRILIDVV